MNRGNNNRDASILDDIRSLANSKRGITPWISWIILVTFVIFVGALVSTWMKDQVNDSVDTLKDKASLTESCDGAGIDVRNIVQKSSQTLEMIVINTYDTRIDQLVITAYTSGKGVVSTGTSNVTIRPNSNKTVLFSANSTTAILKIIPVYFEDKEGSDRKRRVCSDKAVERNITAG